MREEIIFEEYVRFGLAEMTPWKKDFDLERVSISSEDMEALSPKEGDMIARNPVNHDDMWLISEDYFKANFEKAATKEQLSEDVTSKSLHNTTANGAKENVKDIVFWGNGDTFKLISKASSEAEGWMKSTKAMEVPNGCVVQVTTQQRNPEGDYVIAEALTFVPGARVREVFDGKGKVSARTLK